MIDKRRAKKDEFRVSEKELFIYGVLCGAIGGFIAMWTFRHKTVKKSFCIPYVVLFTLNLLFLLVILVVLIAAPTAIELQQQ